MKAVKIIIGIVIAAIAVLAIVVFIGLKSLNSLVEMAIESVGPNVTKTPVSVEMVNIEVTKGRGEIRGLMVKNPPGYTTENALDLGTIVLQIEPTSLVEPVIVINELTIDGSKLTAEHKGLADINLQQLYENINANSKRPASEPTPTTGSPDLRFMLEKVSFTNISLDLISEEYGSRALTMADIQLSNLGNKQDGLTAEELANALLKPVVDAARKKVNDELKGKATEKLKETLEEKLSEEDKGKLDSLKSLINK